MTRTGRGQIQGPVIPGAVIAMGVIAVVVGHDVCTRALPRCTTGDTVAIALLMGTIVGGVLAGGHVLARNWHDGEEDGDAA